ncbi:MAG: Mrp/NBP35 family ATP-binding protein, partial [Crenarchaeota archaeon]|nr:Mrp/NBP35 family ATP-binding protein [Thermoproteota archaeon]
KAVTFAKQIGVPIIGIVENMSGFVCPECGAKVDIFRFGGGKKVAEEMGVPFLGSIPLDPKICRNSDEGLSFIAENVSSPATKAFIEIVQKVKQFLIDNNSQKSCCEKSCKGNCKC